jgi:hypothetical protein
VLDAPLPRVERVTGAPDIENLVAVLAGDA